MPVKTVFIYGENVSEFTSILHLPKHFHVMLATLLKELASVSTYMMIAFVFWVPIF